MSAHSPLAHSLADQRILVIGAGPAGLAAAVTAAELGLRVVLVDEAAAPGGQYPSPDHWSGDPLSGHECIGAEHRFSTRAEREGGALVARAHALSREAGASLELRWGATVWSLSPNSDGRAPGLTAMVYSLAGDGVQAGSACMEADAVILATGARETVPPFPGWTLPGVMAVGGGSAADQAPRGESRRARAAGPDRRIGAAPAPGSGKADRGRRARRWGSGGHACRRFHARDSIHASTGNGERNPQLCRASTVESQPSPADWAGGNPPGVVPGNRTRRRRSRAA